MAAGTSRQNAPFVRQISSFLSQASFLGVQTRDVSHPQIVKAAKLAKTVF